jgi:hypothetical protein
MQPDAQRDDAGGGIAEDDRSELRTRARGVGLTVFLTRADEVLFELLRFGLLVRKLGWRLLLRPPGGGRRRDEKDRGKQDGRDSAHENLLGESTAMQDCGDSGVNEN